MSLKKLEKIIILKEHFRTSKNCSYNHRHNIYRLSDALPNFLFPTSETKRDY